METLVTPVTSAGVIAKDNSGQNGMGTKVFDAVGLSAAGTHISYDVTLRRRGWAR